MRKIGIAKIEATCQNSKRKEKIRNQPFSPLSLLI